MLSRRLTVTVPLLVVALSGCENQGKGVGTDAIETICDLLGEAIERNGCQGMDIQCGEPVLKKDYFVNECKSNNRVVQGRCRTEQRGVADCLLREIEAKGGSADRQAAFTELFTCVYTQPTWRALASETQYNEYNFTYECPASVNTTEGTPELCAKVKEEARTKVLDPTLRNCGVRWGSVNGVEQEIGRQNGNAKVKDSGADTPPLFCQLEIDALSKCSAKPPANAP